MATHISFLYPCTAPPAHCPSGRTSWCLSATTARCGLPARRPHAGMCSCRKPRAISLSEIRRSAPRQSLPSRAIPRADSLPDYPTEFGFCHRACIECVGTLANLRHPCLSVHADGRGQLRARRVVGTGRGPTRGAVRGRFGKGRRPVRHP